MQYLLDTHILLWFINGDTQLSQDIKSKIANINNSCFLSIASIWEIAVKISIGKLSLNAPFNYITAFLTDNNIEILPIAFEHIATLLTLEFHHKDPFDRLIISQAITENLTLLTHDKAFLSYPVKVVM